MNQVPLTLGQGHRSRSRSNFPKNGKNAYDVDQRSKSKFPQNGLDIKQLAISRMLFHPQASSYLLSQLFVTHLGVALLLILFSINCYVNAPVISLCNEDNKRALKHTFTCLQ